MRLIAISDTHGKHGGLILPDGDALIHAGDFCLYGQKHEAKEFAKWFASQPHSHKLVVPGNHDLCMEYTMGEIFIKKDIHYLRDSGVEIDSINFWGSPWTPPFFNWAFMADERSLSHRWSEIPMETNVLITHGPPRGILDACPDFRNPQQDVHVGSVTLAEHLCRFRFLKAHIFGHIHEGYGHAFEHGINFHNVAICTGDYKPTNPVTIIDL